MESFEVFVNNIIGNNTSDPTLTDKEIAYIASLKNDMTRIRIEFVRHVAQIVVDEDRTKFLTILDALIAISPNFDESLVDFMEPIFIVFEPRVSDILNRSHLFCCHKYKSGPVNEWSTRNAEFIVPIELGLYQYIFKKFSKYMEIDVPEYSEKEVCSKKKCPKKIKQHDKKEQLRQFYSCILHLDV